MSRKRNTDQGSPDTNPTAVADAPAAEALPEGQSFADKVGQRNRVAIPDPFPIVTDPVAGVKLFEDKREQWMAIKFDQKPPQAVIDTLKDAGYRWNPAHKIWVHPVRGDSAMRTRIDAERLYQEIRTMIRQEKGIAASAPEVPF
jgi:hypothetical protein